MSDHVDQFGRLAGEQSGRPDDRPPLLLLHGLTFDRSTWRPALQALEGMDPDRQVLTLDLPGHGASPPADRYDLRAVAAEVHEAAAAAGLESPVVVGHSMGAVLAMVYAASHPTSGVVDVDQTLDTAGFATFLQSIADKLRSSEFPAIWANVFAPSFHAELLDDDARRLVETTSRPEQSLVLGYWRQVLDDPPEATEALARGALTAIAAAGVPMLHVSGSELPAGYRRWLVEQVPGATLVEWPASSHFPHLAHPARFAALLAATAGWRAA